jgi:glycosyltransferase involved in cell wall biosynthesis
MTTGRPPSVSVVIPAYNAERWIAKTIEAVLGQTVPPGEVVVVDDGSTDRTREELEPYADRLRVIGQENAGAAAAYNTGFRAASGDFAAKCPADDLWVPEKLEWQLQTLSEHPEVDVAFGRARDFGTSEGDLPTPSTPGVLRSREFLPILYRTNVIASPTALVRRSLHERLGGFREDLAAGEDYDFWLRALENGAVFFFDPRLLANLRKHGGNLSTQPVLVWDANYRIHGWHAEKLDDPVLADRTLAKDLLTLARSRLGAGQVKEARSAYRSSLRHRPSLMGILGTVGLSIPGSAAAVRRLNLLRA